MSVYATLVRAKGLYDGAKSIDDMVDNLVAAITELRELRKDGLTVVGTVADDYAELVTEDEDVATKHGMVEVDI